MTRQTNRTAQILTYAGLLPFLLLSVAICLDIKGCDFSLALRAYGTAIISFLCGIHWAAYLFFEDKCQRNLLIFSNIITLIAVGCFLFASPKADLIMQSLCLVFLLMLDYSLKEKQVIPLWFLNLRRNATLVVIILLLGVVHLS